MDSVSIARSNTLVGPSDTIWLERFASAAANHAETEATLLEMSSLGTDVPLDDNVSVAREGWQLFRKMFD